MFEKKARDTKQARRHCWGACKGQGRHCKPFSHRPASLASAGTGRDSHLSRLTHPWSQGLLHSRRLQGNERNTSQSLLGNQPWVPLPEMGICQCWWGLSAKAEGKETRSRERTAVGCTDTTEGTGVWGSVAPRGNEVYLGNEMPLLSGRQGVGPPPPPHARPCLRGHWVGLPPEWAHPSLLQLPAGLWCCRQFMHTPVVATISLSDLSE